MDVSALFLKTSIERVDASFEKIEHCFNQLSEEDIWWAPNEASNSIGNILLHLCGNLRQWIISGVGGAKDVRNRPEEFKKREPISKTKLFQDFKEVLVEVKEVLRVANPKILTEVRRIQGFDVVLLGAIYDTISHLDLHAGQVLYITKLKLGANYKLRWKPANKEQGAD